MNTNRALIVISMLLIATIAVAQTSTGQLSGLVAEDSGAALPGVTITAKNRDTGVTRTTVSNSEGQYVLPLLPSGTYDIVAELSGFQAIRRQNVVITVGSDVTLRLPLRVGVAESITVSGDAPVVEATRSSVASTVNETMIENLPVNGRNFIDFAVTTPGVSKDARFGDISFAGLRGTLNSLVVDGADNNNTFFGQSLGRTGDRTAYQFSQDAVKEFQVNTNAYSAEYGRAGGAVINVITKSGTNKFDGGAFFFFRDRDLRSRDYIEELNNRVKGPYQFDQYGVSVGGPIVPDRHFFFANYDGQRNTEANTIVFNVPAGTPGDAETVAGLARLRDLAFDYERKRDQDVFLIKTDHEILKSHLAVRYNRQDFAGENQESSGATVAFEHSGNSLRIVDTFAANFATPISNTFFNELRGQYAKDEEPGSANSANPEATVRQGGQQVLVIGRNFFSPRETTITRWQIADSATLLRGSHTIKAGLDVNNDEIENFFPGNFSGAYTFQTIASFQRGIPSGANERYVQAFAGPGTTGPLTNPDQMETAFFIHDEWQARPNLTFNAGLRYDLQDVAQPEVRNPDAQLAAAGIDTSDIPVDSNNFAPRLGVAWTPAFSQRTVVRAGYGLFYGRTPAIMVGTAHSNNGINVQTITFTGNLVPTYPNTLATIPTGATIPKPTIFAFDSDYENPMVHQASFGVEHALTNTIAVGASLLWVQGNDLSRSTDVNLGTPVIEQIPISTGGTVPVLRYPTAQPFTNFARIIEFQSTADSEYRGVTLDLNKRFGQNWQARLAYTYADVKDNKPDATAVVPEGSDDAKFAWDPTDFDLEWGASDNDIRHRMVLSGVWNLEYGQGSDALWSRMLLQGWALSGIVSWQTGFPYSGTVGVDLNRDRNTRNDRAPGLERNSFRTEDQLSIDPRISKAFPLRGDLRLQLIAEAFNITNESNVTGVRTGYYNFANNTLSPVSNFQEPLATSGAAGSGPRTIQLAAKLSF
ncbi:MAG: carboxypeptidase regulatory-like domain-containing protein [Thermoanaerobaculia bacterium]|nr:carboxypeptidase regulatory-like domain-containing protein [Thermoanaerobaculia bacterium]